MRAHKFEVHGPTRSGATGDSSDGAAADAFR